MAGPNTKTFSGRGICVLVHCRGGLGRAGLAATSLLKTIFPELSIRFLVEHVRHHRPGAIETEDQERWLLQYHNPMRGLHHEPESLIQRYLSARQMLHQDVFASQPAHPWTPQCDRAYERFESSWEELTAGQQDRTQQVLSALRL